MSNALEDRTYIVRAIDVLEGLEDLLDIAPDDKIEQILLGAWATVSGCLPEDFLRATQMDAGAEGLRRYLRVKAFFDDPQQHQIDSAELQIYHQNLVEPISDMSEFFYVDTV